MEKKNVTQVVIDGKIYKLGGYESEEYLHQVASYLNNKIPELKSLDGYHRLPAAMKSLMLDLNTADDYFKVKKQADRLENEMSDKDRELYQIKHELVSLQVKQEDAAKQILSYREEISDYQKRIVELETRLHHMTSGAGIPAGDPGAEEEKTEAAETAVKAEAPAEDSFAASAQQESWTERYSQAVTEGAQEEETALPSAFFAESVSGSSPDIISDSGAEEADGEISLTEAGEADGSGRENGKEAAAEKRASWPNRNKGKNKKRR